MNPDPGFWPGPEEAFELQIMTPFGYCPSGGSHTTVIVFVCAEPEGRWVDENDCSDKFYWNSTLACTLPTETTTGLTETTAGTTDGTTDGTTVAPDSSTEAGESDSDNLSEILLGVGIPSGVTGILLLVLGALVLCCCCCLVGCTVLSVVILVVAALSVVITGVGISGGIKLIASRASAKLFSSDDGSNGSEGSEEFTTGSSEPTGSSILGKVSSGLTTTTNYDSPADTSRTTPENSPSGSPATPRKIADSGGIDFSELEIGRKIGQGSFGEVFTGTWHGAQVAVKKVIAPKTEVETVLEEARILSRIGHHPNVLRYLGLTTHTAINPAYEEIYFVMEFYELGSLENYLHIHHTSREQKLNIAIEAAAGVSHLHARGCIHRDIAARNFLVGADGHLRVADFGMSRLIEIETPGQTETQSGPFRWMAPEAIEKRLYSKASDVWSFGVFIWEVWTGQHPYCELAAGEVIAGVLRPEMMRLPEVEDPEVQELLNDIFVREPSIRPTVEEIQQRLRKMLIQQVPPSFGSLTFSSAEDGVIRLQDSLFSFEGSDSSEIVGCTRSTQGSRGSRGGSGSGESKLRVSHHVLRSSTD